jgi:biotin transport system substrate-specific component
MKTTDVAIQNRLLEVVSRPAIKTALGIAGLMMATTLGAWVRIPLPFTPVPIIMQDFAVLLGAAMLGKQRGTIAQMLYLSFGSFGLPLFAGVAALTPYLLGPTGGYLIGFVAASVFVGYAVSRSTEFKFYQIAMIFLAATALIFVPGLIQLKFWLHSSFSNTMMLGFVPFIPGSLIKIGVASSIYYRYQTKFRQLWN